jgi:hypothetical protein
MDGDRSPAAFASVRPVNTLAPKLVLTPLLIASTSVLGRRWGPALSGWLVALPLTSGPIVLFIALEAGADVARQAAGGSLLGAVAQVAFAAAYVGASRRLGWMPSLAVATVVFFVVGFGVPALLPVATYLVLVVAVAAFLTFAGQRPTSTGDLPAPPTWDIPARVVVATMLVVGISALAPVIGGRASGVLATFPVYAAVLTTFAHINRGPVEATGVLRGLATGLLGFGGFFLTLGWLLEFAGIAESFIVALAVGFAMQVATLPLVRRAVVSASPRA